MSAEVGGSWTGLKITVRYRMPAFLPSLVMISNPWSTIWNLTVNLTKLNGT